MMQDHISKVVSKPEQRLIKSLKRCCADRNQQFDCGFSCNVYRNRVFVLRTTKTILQLVGVE